MKKIALAVIAAILILAAAGWYFFSPQMALAGLRDAAVEGDAEAVIEYIDLPAFKTSVKDQLKQQMTTKLASGDENGLGAAFGMALVEPMIDAMLTEENIAAMVENQTAASTASTVAGSNKTAPQPNETPEMEIQRTGFDEFRVHSIDASDKGTLIFRRDGLGWRLSGMELPEKLFDER